MTILNDRFIVCNNLSDGWLDAVRVVNSVPSRKLVHLLVRILDPMVESVDIRGHAQWLIDEWNSTHAERRHLYDVESTRNTIFPAVWANRNPEPEDLAAYYRDRYTKDGLLGFSNNSRGTYFGRIVAYPRGAGQEPGDQLSSTVRKLRNEIRSGRPKSSRYEINIYCEQVDTSPMSFPCLAHLSVHLHERKLHMQAIYRNEYLVGRAYGNYLGLAELQRYMARASGVEVGELMVTIGHVELDGSKRAVGNMLASLDSPRGSL
jgi:thymidylate synthase